MQNGASSYDISVHDASNNNIIADENFTNTNLDISNLPVDNAIIEFQLRSNGGLLNNATILSGIIMKFT